jgi:dTDP-4-dehydrorhamnose reductase
MIKIQKNNLSGIIHFGGSEKLSRYEFALKISEKYNLNDKLINPIKSYELNWIAKRPKDTSLISKFDK